MIGYFFSASNSHSVTQTFQSTGLQYADMVDLSFDVLDNSLNGNNTINWNVLINNTQVGIWSWGGANGEGQANLSFSFVDIIGEGNYIIAMQVASDVVPGGGSIALGLDGRMTLYGDSGSAAPVPEPASVLLLGIGLVGVATIKKRLSRNK
jgi:hypothetical protein